MTGTTACQDNNHFFSSEMLGTVCTCGLKRLDAGKNPGSFRVVDAVRHSMRERGSPTSNNFPVQPPGQYELATEVILVVPFLASEKMISDRLVDEAEIVIMQDIYGDWNVWQDLHGVISGIRRVSVRIVPL